MNVIETELKNKGKKFKMYVYSHHQLQQKQEIKVSLLQFGNLSRSCMLNHLVCPEKYYMHVENI